MAKFLVVPDKFKGSVSAQQAVRCIIQGCKSITDKIEFTGIPIADGGEGSLLSIRQAIGGELVHCQVLNGIGQPVDAFYLQKGDTVYIETSLSCGLTLLPESQRNPMNTSTFGVGMLIRHAISRGCKQVHLFLGGSGTHDGGAGMASALGFGCTDADGVCFLPTGKTLGKIARICPLPWGISLDSVEFHAWTDVDVPLTGDSGSIQFARQKGASETDLQHLEQGMKHYAAILQDTFPDRFHENLAGAGAAGGLGAGCTTFLNAKMGSAWHFISGLCQLEKHVSEADLVITGEGRLDTQSMKGKVVGGISALCRSGNKQLVILCGQSDLADADKEKLGNPLIIELRMQGEPLAKSLVDAPARLEAAAREVTKDWFSGKVQENS